jgi:GNAT superfamily N-acetyltransferase
VRLVEADASHIPALAANMREADRIEIGAFGRTPAKALGSGLSSSVWALTALVDDEPHAMMGVVPVNVLDGIGVPWMLGSERIYDHARDLVRYGPGIIAEMRRGFERLENMVHVDNHRAIRFLRHLGWTISDCRETYGGIEFVRFSN